MATTAKPQLEICPSGAPLAADVVGIDLHQPLDQNSIAEIKRAWHEHLVLRFRDQQIGDDDLVRFSKNFGTLDLAPITTTGQPWLAGYPELNVISNVVVDGRPIGGLGYGESEWHTDMSYKDAPPNASILYAIEVPSGAGNTSFGNMYSAADTLPTNVRKRIEGLLCKHDASINSTGQLRKGFGRVTDPREAPGAAHPLLRTHPVTKRKALFLGRRNNAHIVGLELADSEELLDLLWAHATRLELTWTQEWRIGDLIMWDNRCTMHRRDAFDGELRRILHRAQVAGDRPF